MVTKNFVQTAIAGLRLWILQRLEGLEITEFDALDVLAEAGFIAPIADEANNLYVDEKNTIYTF